VPSGLSPVRRLPRVFHSSCFCRSACPALVPSALCGPPPHVFAGARFLPLCSDRCHHTVLTNTGSVGSYTLTGAVSSTATTAGGPTGQVAFIDQTTSATLGTALLSAPMLTTGSFTSTDSLSFSVFEPAAAPVKYCGYKQMGQVVTTDFDGDGNLDLAFAGTFICSASDPYGAVSSSAIFLAQGNGNGTFELIPPTVRRKIFFFRTRFITP
jgi:hypothetical protein